MTFDNASFASLGLTPGTYTYTWDTADSFVINIGATTVPEPANFALFVSGLGALGLLRWRRKRKAQAAA